MLFKKNAVDNRHLKARGDVHGHQAAFQHQRAALGKPLIVQEAQDQPELHHL